MYIHKYVYMYMAYINMYEMHAYMYTEYNTLSIASTNSFILHADEHTVAAHVKIRRC